LDEKRHKNIIVQICLCQSGQAEVDTVRGAFHNHNALSDMSNYTREIAMKECYLASLLSFSLLQSHLIEVRRFEKRR